jgi:lipopolysaccharide heptosyltransferase I
MKSSQDTRKLKILILKPSSLGDIIQALPVLRSLKRHLPNSEIYWWIESSLAPLLEGDRDLAGIVRFERQRWAAPKHWAELGRTLMWTRRHAFDWVIDLQGLARSAVFGWLANAKWTVGLDDAREGARGFYDSVARRELFHTHAVDRYLGVLPLLGVPFAPNLEWLPRRHAIADIIYKKWPIADSRWLILQPGARWLNKRWPAEFFGELLKQLSEHYPELQFAILGGVQDRALGETIARVAPKRCLDLTGALSLLEMVEWIRICELMVSNDTGPMHVAAALGKPVIALFGPTEPRRTGPYAQLKNVLQLNIPCVPCLKSRCHYSPALACLRDLTPSAVFGAVADHLGAGV